MTWVTSASHAETSSVARLLLSRDLSGLCLWTSCVFLFHAASFLEHLCISPQAAPSSLRIRAPGLRGFRKYLMGTQESMPNVQGPQMSLME